MATHKLLYSLLRCKICIFSIHRAVVMQSCNVISSVTLLFLTDSIWAVIMSGRWMGRLSELFSAVLSITTVYIHMRSPYLSMKWPIQGIVCVTHKQQWDKLQTSATQSGPPSSSINWSSVLGGSRSPRRSIASSRSRFKALAFSTALTPGTDCCGLPINTRHNWQSSLSFQMSRHSIHSNSEQTWAHHIHSCSLQTFPSICMVPGLLKYGLVHTYKHR